MAEMIDRISIQVGLSGYSFRLETNSGVRSSGWMNSDCVFTTKEFQSRYADVEIALFTPYCTLVPQDFFCEESSRDILADVTRLPENACVEFVKVPELASVLIYSQSIGGTLHKVISESVLRVDGTKARPLPEMYYMLKSLPALEDYNRIVAAYMDGVLYLVIAQGKTLLLCNSYRALDFTTAEYFIFMAMKKLQLNPEMSTITFRTQLTEEQEISLYRYFKSVDII